MAIWDFASGRPVSNPVPNCVYDYIFAKEFGWVPSQADKEDNRRIHGILKVLNFVNKKTDQDNKKPKK